MLRSGDHFLVSFPIIRVEAGLLAIDQPNPVPQLASTFAAAVANLEGYDLLAPYVNGNPDPSFVLLFVLLTTDKTPHFIGFRFKSQVLYLRIDGVG